MLGQGHGTDVPWQLGRPTILLVSRLSPVCAPCISVRVATVLSIIAACRTVFMHGSLEAVEEAIFMVFTDLVSEGGAKERRKFFQYVSLTSVC